MAPKTTTVDIEPSNPITKPSAAMGAKIDQLNLGPFNNIPVDEDEWEDVNEPIAPPPDEFTMQSSDAWPKKNSNYYLQQWLRSSCDSYVRLTYEHDAPPSGTLCAGCNSPVTHLVPTPPCPHIGSRSGQEVSDGWHLWPILALFFILATAANHARISSKHRTYTLAIWAVMLMSVFSTASMT
ncbi:unnamed protein product [Rhizoctonia solani]|uniref:Uncharacterized protein n=1 Tax=Rhizoctonia solani TaxID=456999 RepID=A0A8H3B4Y3_9AGAM|nr:unnamed protein product [Rhizoctonia solani]